jgi:hypothetical protein
MNVKLFYRIIESLRNFIYFLKFKIKIKFFILLVKLI